MSRASRLTPGNSSTRCRSRMSISSRAFRRPSPSSSATRRPIRARQSPRPPRFTIICGCFSPRSASRTIPATGAPIFKLTPQQIVDQIVAYPPETKIMLLAPFVRAQTGEFRDVFEQASSARASCGRGSTGRSSSWAPDPIKLDKAQAHSIEIVVDRLVMREGVRTRLADSVDTALKWGGSRLVVLRQTPERRRGGRRLKYSTDFCNPETDFTMPQLTPKHFSFNSHLGACPACHGLGTESFFDCDLMIPDPQKSLKEGAVAPGSGRGSGCSIFTPGSCGRSPRAYPSADWTRPMRTCRQLSSRRSVSAPGTEPLEIVWGKGRRPRSAERPFEGLVAQMQRLYEETRERIYAEPAAAVHEPAGVLGVPRGAAAAGDPGGDGGRDARRSRSERSGRSWRSLNIRQFCGLTVADARAFIENLELTAQQRIIVAEVTREILARLGFSGGGRAGLSESRPRERHALRRRGAADPAGDADRLGAGGRPVCAGRAEHRPAPAR